MGSASESSRGILQIGLLLPKDVLPLPISTPQPYFDFTSRPFTAPIDSLIIMMPPLPITSTSFTDIKAHLRANPERIDAMQIPCLLCRRTTTLDPSDESGQLCPGVVVLPCGHCFGERCTRKYFAETQWLDDTDKCPLCNELLTNKRMDLCRHRVMPFPFRGLEDLDKAPRCLDEGGQIPLFCMLCVLWGYLENMGLDIQVNMPRELRGLCGYEFIFRLHIDWDVPLNVRCVITDRAIEHGGSISFFVRLSPPTNILSEDNRVVEYDGTPLVYFGCPLLGIMRRRLGQMRAHNEGTWTPKILGVSIGIIPEDDEYAEGELEALQEFFSTVHEHSEHFQRYVDGINNELSHAIDRARDVAPWRQRGDGPLSDTTSIADDREVYGLNGIALNEHSHDDTGEAHGLDEAILNEDSHDEAMG